jgi:D-alanyl-D-alanine carboxypeptidase
VITDDTPTAEVTPAPDSPCVADPEAVVNADPQDAGGSLGQDLQHAIQTEAVKAFNQGESPGAIFAVRTERGQYVGAVGWADLAKTTLMEEDTRVRIGSVTKTFTGTLLVQLEAAGFLSLDDPIEKYWLGLPNGDRITLRMLAYMTSGLASYTKSAAWQDIYFNDHEKSWTVPELVGYGIAESPEFEPGAQFSYSNTNTVLLGAVISQVTGEPFEDVLYDRILDPLDMDDTVWPTDTTLPEPYAEGITEQGQAEGEPPANATHWNPTWGNAAGQLVSTVHDLLDYGYALATGRGIMDPDTTIKRLESLSGPFAGTYGEGYACYSGWVGHEGSLPGYNSYVAYDTRGNNTVVILTTSDIKLGECEPGVTDTGLDDPRCLSPSGRILAAISKVLGHEWVPIGSH